MKIHVISHLHSSQLDSFSSRPAQSPSSTTSEVLSLLVQLRDHDTEKWKSVIEQYELLNKFTDIFIALAEQIDQEGILLLLLLLLLLLWCSACCWWCCVCRPNVGFCNLYTNLLFFSKQ